MTKATGFLTALAALSLAGAALAEDVDEFASGRAEYLASCAACHGEEADGKGEIATMFRVPMPNLRRISAENDGVFPFIEIFHIIDGRTGVRAHGVPMPLFGERYKREIGDTAGPFGSEVLTRARVLELALYIQSIQE